MYTGRYCEDGLFRQVNKMTREEAIQVLHHIVQVADTSDCGIKEIDGTDEEAIKMAIKALEQEQKWIPVSERLPEDEQEILFSTKTGRVHSGKYHDDDSANQWYSHRDKCRAWNNVVTAWLPLPKPYEPQERSEKE